LEDDEEVEECDDFDGLRGTVASFFIEEEDDDER
jgi:hypothetical protein